MLFSNELSTEKNVLSLCPKECLQLVRSLGTSGYRHANELQDVCLFVCVSVCFRKGLSTK